MCDYSLQQVQSRPAKVADKLVTHNFGTGTRGFCSPDDPSTAVCVLPGTELAFDRPIEANVPTDPHQTAIFRQMNKTVPHTHHDALELPWQGSFPSNPTRLWLPRKGKRDLQTSGFSPLCVLGSGCGWQHRLRRRPQTERST